VIGVVFEIARFVSHQGEQGGDFRGGSDGVVAEGIDEMGCRVGVCGTFGRKGRARASRGCRRNEEDLCGC